MPTKHSRRAPPATRSAAPAPIRIVPLRRPRMGAPAPAKLTYRGGPLLEAVQVFSLYWGATWSEAPQATTRERLNKFFTDVVASPYLDQLAEYDTQLLKIIRGKFIGSATIHEAAPATSVSDDQIREFLQTQIAAQGAVPAPTANTLYFILTPPGVSVALGRDRSCQAFCGYHDVAAPGRYYAVVPSPDCGGCLGDLTVLDALTSVASHELAEAITDPVPGQGWYDDAQGEIGDICAWENKKLGAHTVQLLWSNRAQACV